MITSEDVDKAVSSAVMDGSGRGMRYTAEDVEKAVILRP